MLDPSSKNELSNNNPAFHWIHSTSNLVATFCSSCSINTSESISSLDMFLVHNYMKFKIVMSRMEL